MALKSKFTSIMKRIHKKDGLKTKTESGGGNEDESATQDVNVHRLTNDPHNAWHEMGLAERIRNVSIPKDLAPMSSKKLRFVCISDTHTFFEDQTEVAVPDGDVLLHCGDFCLHGSMSELRSFNNFIGKLPHRYKIVIAGNHDEILDSRNESPKYTEYLLKNYGVREVRELLSNCTYIEDEMIQLAGLNIYGSPWVPVYLTNGYALERGEELLQKWKQIPTNVDILMTHAPPLGAGDLVKSGKHVGCVELLNVVQKRVQPVYHIFGHIHEGYGMYTDGTTTFINASSCNRKYQAVNEPVVFDVDIPRGHNKKEPIIRINPSLSDKR